MRKLEKFTDGFSEGYRSDSNGKIEVAEFITSTIFDENEIFKRYYRKVKPYWRVESQFTLPYVNQVYFQGGRYPYQIPSISYLATHLDKAAKVRYSKSIQDLLSDPDYAINGAIEKSLAYGTVLMFVTLAEADKTILLFRKLFIRLFNIVKDVYNSVKKLNLAATVDILADIWLELRYAWRPLAGEIQGIAEALTVVRPDGIKSAYGTYKFPKDRLKTDSVFLPNVQVEENGFMTIFDVTMSGFEDVTRKAGFNYVNKPGSRNLDMKAIFGLDVGALASTVWELIPFSFIVDMFLNIGNMLQTNSSVDQVDSFNGYLTNRFTCNVHAVAKDVLKYNEFEVPDLKEYGSFSPYESRLFKWSIEHYVTDAETVREQLLTTGRGNYYYFDGRRSINANVPNSYGYVYGFAATPIAATPELVTAHIESQSGSFLSVLLSGFRNKIYYEQRRDPEKKEMYKVMVEVQTKLNALDLPTKQRLFNDLFEIIPNEYRVAQVDRAKELYRVSNASDWYLNIPGQEFPELTEYLSGWYFRGFQSNQRQQWSYALRGTGYLPTLCDFLPLETSAKTLFLERGKRLEFNHSFTHDTDLSSGQYADLSAFGVKLGGALKKAIKIK